MLRLFQPRFETTLQIWIPRKLFCDDCQKVFYSWSYSETEFSRRRKTESNRAKCPTGHHWGTYINDVWFLKVIFDPPTHPHPNFLFLPSNDRFLGVILDPPPPWNRTLFVYVSLDEHKTLKLQSESGFLSSSLLTFLYVAGFWTSVQLHFHNFFKRSVTAMFPGADYGHTMAKSVILCSPNSNPNPK